MREQPDIVAPAVSHSPCRPTPVPKCTLAEPSSHTPQTEPSAMPTSPKQVVELSGIASGTRKTRQIDGNGRRAVPDARRRQHGAENRHRLGTVAQGALAAWATLRRVARSGVGNAARHGRCSLRCAGCWTELNPREASARQNPVKVLDERGNELALSTGWGWFYISSDLAEWLDKRNMGHVRGAPCHPQTQGKIERWHQTLKNCILLENYYLPDDLESRIDAFVDPFLDHISL
jgi:transposase InsO family protein